MADTPLQPMTFGNDGTVVDPRVPVPKRVIRTFASDMATASGAPAPAPKPPAPVAESVVLPTPDPVGAYVPAEERAQRGWVAPEKEREQYSVDEEMARPVPLPQQPPRMERYVERSSGPGFMARLFGSLFGSDSRSEEGRILTSTVIAPPAQPAPAPLPEPLPPPPPPQPVPVAAPEPIPVTTDQGREEVLARLRARVASREGEAPQAIFPTPKPEMPVSRGQYQGPPANLPGIPPEPVVVQAPQPLQTYSGDFAQRIDRQDASAFAVMAADMDRRRAGPAPLPRRTAPNYGLIYIIASTVLVVGGSLSLYFAYSYFRSGQPVELIRTPASSLIAADEEVKIRKEDGDAYRLFRDASLLPLSSGNIRVVYYTIATTTTVGVTDVKQSGTTFLRAMRLRAPELLMRNLSPETTLGSVGTGESATPFFILGTLSYERSFAGMLQWEGTIAQDLSILYPEYPILAVVETGTSTPAIAPVGKPQFRDEVVESYDVRVLRDAEGRSLMLYGYRDPETLILVRDEAAFAAVLTRFTGTSRE